MTKKELEDAIMHLSEEEASKLLERHGMQLRPLIVDGEQQIVTMDYRLDRLNVSIANGKVCGIEKWG